jgi:hypothetical protein
MAKGDGAEDLKGCRAASEKRRVDDFKVWFCMGIVQGALWSLQKASAVCLPDDGVSTGQGLIVLVKYMNDHPEELHEQTSILAFRAFVKAWPCSHDSEKPADESFRKP